MAFDVREFTGAFSGGDLARGNLFEVELPFMGRNFKFKAKGTSLPESTVGAIDLFYQGRPIPLGGDRPTVEWTVSVYCDADHQSRNDMISWQNLIHSNGPLVSGESPETYLKDASVKVFNRKLEETARANLFSIFPLTVSPIELSWEDVDTVSMFDVTFKVSYWEMA
jgi:hypothetical protein